MVEKIRRDTKMWKRKEKKNKVHSTEIKGLTILNDADLNMKTMNK